MLKGNHFVWLTLILLLPLTAAQAQGKKITPDELMAAHLKSIGNPEVLKGIKSRVMTGFAAVKFIQGASGSYNDGGFVFASEPQRLGLAMKFSALEYPGEYFAYDGRDVTVGNIKPGQKSPVAEFVDRFNALAKEGLLGGALSVAWPLLNLKERQAEIKCTEGKLDGKPVYEVEYRPKKPAGDLKIKLFFDAENFRHVRTEYKVIHSSDMSSTRNVVSSAQALEPRTQATQGSMSEIGPNATIMGNVANSYYKLVEKFDNFQKAGELTLPYSYTIEYEIQGQGASFLANWSMRASGQFTNNGQIGAEFFKAKN
jgi:hypothetical protein